MPWLYLGLAIVAELIGTSLLKSTEGFTRLGPSVGCLTAYGFAFVGLAQAVKTLPLGVVYALWAGLGTAAVALIGVTVFGEPLTPAKLAGIGLIVAGVVVLHLGGAHG